jgi:hypothetical protein
VGFTDDVNDPTVGHAVSLDGESTCLIAFGGIAGGLVIPPFEFFRLTEDLPVGKVFIRDHDQAWYQFGVRGLGDDPASACAALRATLDDHGVRRVVTFGNSAGGFAAILFGVLLGAAEIHAFAPQTSMTRGFRARHVDRRWSSEVRAMRRRRPADPTLDLAPVLAGADAHGPINVYFAQSHRLDRAHATHLAGAPQVTLHPAETGDHALIRGMRDSGLLRQILETSLAG